MRIRLPGNTLFLLLSCITACFATDAAAEQFLVTVLRSSDPVEVRELLGQQPPAAGNGPVGRQRSFRTSGYGQRRHSRWQVVVSDGQAALLATGSVTPQLQIPWIELTRHGPVPHASLTERKDMQGIYVQARRLRHEVEVELHQFSDRVGPDGIPGRPGTGLRTVLHGRPGQWLDAGGSLLLDNVPSALRSYTVRHRDPWRFRLLVRVDLLD